MKEARAAVEHTAESAVRARPALDILVNEESATNRNQINDFVW